jgi:hypothetical protein
MQWSETVAYLERQLPATPAEQAQDVQRADEDCKRRCKLEAQDRNLYIEETWYE